MERFWPKILTLYVTQSVSTIGYNMVIHHGWGWSLDAIYWQGITMLTVYLLVLRKYDAADLGLNPDGTGRGE